MSGDVTCCCSDCGRTFTTRTGLGVHRRRAHPNTFHEEKVKEREEGLTRARWSTEELERLARLELSVGCVRAINQLLQANFPHRSVESIKSARRQSKYRALLSRYRDPVIEEIESPEVTDEASEKCDMKENIRAWAADQLKEQPKAGRDILEVLSRGVVEEVRAFLESYLKCPDARQRQTVISRKGESQALQGRKKRKKEYADMQHLWNVDRKKAAHLALSGRWHASDDVQLERTVLCDYWRNIFESERKSDKRRHLSPKVGPLLSLLEPVQVSEVMALMKDVQNTAAGPDGITNKQFKKQNPLLVAAVLNAVLLSGVPPSNFLVSRTTLLPKTECPSDPGEYRPISTGNVHCRLFHRLLARRLQPFLSLDESQKAFRQIDGTAANVAILDTLLRDARKNCNDIHIAFVDLKKAFDSVSHDTILRSARSLGLPDQLIGYLEVYYRESHTMLFSNRIDMRNGVRQGDPLSPVLFNAVIDEGVTSIKAKNIGYKMDGHCFSCLGFADDLIMIASTKDGLQEQTDDILDCLKLGGLNPNPRKCRSLSIVGDGKNKRWLCDQRVYLRIGDETAQALNADDVYKYLGIEFTPSGKVIKASDLLSTLLKNVSKAPLKPQQKLFVMRVHLVPQVLHQLVLGQINSGQLLKLDRIMRNSVRSCMHLPKDTPIGFIHARACDGGMAVPNFRTLVPRLQATRMENLMRCKDLDINTVIRSKAFCSTNKRVSKLMSYGGITHNSKGTTNEYWAKELYATIDGKGLTNMDETPFASDWVIGGSSLMSGRSYVNALKIRGNLWGTGARQSRGRRPTPPMCDAGCPNKQTLSHMAQGCNRTHDQRVRRHDRVNCQLAKSLSNIGHEVIIEPRISTPAGLRKPDIVCINSRTNEATVIDTTIVADACVGSLSRSYDNKVQYYNCPAITDWVRKQLDSTSARVNYGALVISWRGALSEKSTKLLTNLGVSRHTLQLLVVQAIEGTCNCALVYQRRTSRLARTKPIP